MNFQQGDITKLNDIVIHYDDIETLPDTLVLKLRTLDDNDMPILKAQANETYFWAISSDISSDKFKLLTGAATDSSVKRQ